MLRNLAVLIFTFLAFSSTDTVVAADKSGVGPNTVSLPKGPGSIEGLGESFQPTLNTGTAKYSVGLKLPPGTAGHSPKLALTYEGGAGNSPVGFGWQFYVPCVQRRTDKGVPLYPGEAPPTTNDDWSARYDSFINDAKEDLVPTTDGFFFCRNEGAFIRYRQTNGYWEATAPNGTRLEFGLTSAGRVEDTNTNPARVFCWLLQRETDTRGNTIEYLYTSFGGSNNLNQKYLAEVRYGPSAPPWANFHFARFRYAERPDWFEDCRAGFAVRTGERLTNIIIGTQGPVLSDHSQGDFNADGIPDNLVRRYELKYLNYAGTNSHWSLLASVTLVGADGTSTLPSSTFGYNVCNPPDTNSAAGSVIASFNEPGQLMNNADVDLIDLNGDALPDLLWTTTASHRAYLNRGESNVAGTRYLQWTSPSTSLAGVVPSYSLSQDFVYLADLDGDGLADFVSQPRPDTIYFFRNQANISWANQRTMIVNGSVPPSPFGNADVRTADVDFDKNIDIIQSQSDRYFVWFNLGTNRYSARKSQISTNVLSFVLPEVQIADFNGDRVPDIVRVRQTSVQVTAGLGYGRFAPSISVPLGELLDSGQMSSARLQDITGDGLADMVIERASGNQLWFWVNLGNYRFSIRKVINGLPSGSSLVTRWADLNGDGATDLIYSGTASSTTNRLNVVDLGQLLNCGATPNILTAISNGIGRVTLIGYQPSTKFALEDAAAGHPWPDPMPFPVQVVAAITNLDSIGHQYRVEFRYHDGYYDPEEKQFRGFARAEQLDIGDPTAPTLVSRSYFDTGRTYEAMKGRLLRLTAETENGRIFSDAFTAWTTPPVALYTGTNGQTVNFAHPVGATNVILELGRGTPRRLESEMEYDRFGNQTRDADFGVVGDGGAFDDERITITDYAINTNAWIIRLPCRVKIMDEGTNIISRTESFYDDSPICGEVIIGNLTMTRAWIDPNNNSAFITAARGKYDTYGNPITLRDPLADGSEGFANGHAREIAYDPLFHTYPITETIHLGAVKQPLVVRGEYDAGFATVTASLDFNTNRTTYGYDTFARLTSIVKPYDTPEYPTAEYSYALAVPVPLAHPMGEGLGVRAMGSGEGVVNYVETRLRDKSEIRNPKSEMYLISRAFLDGLGRVLMTKQEAEPESEGGPSRVVVSGAVQFNVRLKPSRALNPYYSRSGGRMNELLAFENIEAPSWSGQFHENGQTVILNFATAHSSFSIYDATLRAIQSMNQDGTTNRKVYEPLVTRGFDENDVDPASPHFDTPMVHHHDGLGRLIRVDEITRLNDDGTPAGGLQTWTTLYEYDLNDQLTRITDSQGNVKTMTYDGLKRKTFMNDPDRGVISDVYDDAGNEIETTDAKGQRITYTYDGANRILTENYHDEGRGLPFSAERRFNPAQPISASNRPDVAYFYDRPFPNLPQGDNTTATASNSRGMLAYVQDLSGEEHSSYDARGRVAYTVKRIPEPLFWTNRAMPISPLWLVSYKTGFEYDPLDRVTRVTYPDLDQLSYEYNDRALLKRIPGGPNTNVISYLSYLPSGQHRQIDYGNGVRSIYDYDPRLRLTKLFTCPTQPSTDDAQLINFEYDFDGVSNIRGIHDRRPITATLPADDRRRNTQSFGYDSLYRLANVTYNAPAPASVNGGSINYRYDRIGNTLAQDSDIVHNENGLPIANLGQMDSGGALGRWNRVGRGTNSPPGPHALTSITQLSINNAQVRQFPYDANGNMREIDGLTCTWDFKDRLVAVENNEMRTEYTYDYTNRRITKHVVPKNPSTNNFRLSSNQISERFTTIYVNKFFEMREYDAPIKYVWNGSTRIARVSGSLNPVSQRCQFLRLYHGWNLVSINVGQTHAQLDAAVQALIDAAFFWTNNSSGGGFLPLLATTSLPPGSVVWLKANEPSVIALSGSPPNEQTGAQDSDARFVANTTGIGWDVGSAFSPDASLWRFDADLQEWQHRFDARLREVTNLPLKISAGESLFVRPTASNSLTLLPSRLGIRYFHHDHLGSSAIITDSQGHLVEENANYSFGHPRHSFRPHSTREYYQFTQKEQDEETSLHYFEARFLASKLCRFTSVDPLAASIPPESLRSPQELNPYAYCANSPLVFTDPAGTQHTGDWTLDESPTWEANRETEASGVVAVGVNASGELGGYYGAIGGGLFVNHNAATFWDSVGISITVAGGLGGAPQVGGSVTVTEADPGAFFGTSYGMGCSVGAGLSVGGDYAKSTTGGGIRSVSVGGKLGTPAECHAYTSHTFSFTLNDVIGVLPDPKMLSIDEISIDKSPSSVSFKPREAPLIRPRVSVSRVSRNLRSDWESTPGPSKDPPPYAPDDAFFEFRQ